MDYKRAYQIVLKKVEELEEQNERLSNAVVPLDDLRDEMGDLQLKVIEAQEEVERLEAENERLSSALRQIAETPASGPTGAGYLKTVAERALRAIHPTT